ncbi:Predicted metalloprotease, contains C-terminal PDZ domain [Spirosomataceae bacterium TFI 002]|nr:Predicted metalloprotease, contains C-terminal PDZ domain [Spirosomataceae bacterium TFI 002]
MNKFKLTLILFIFALSSCSVAKVSTLSEDYPITYELSVDQPHTHYFDVTMNINKPLANGVLDANGNLLIKMPVWTPGSYLVREYARNVIDFVAVDGNGKTLENDKVNKNTWSINAKGAQKVVVTYKVYAYEMTVRTSFLDDSHGYVNGASVFMFVNGLMDKKSQLKVNPYYKWNTVSTALKPLGNNVFEIKDFDTLVDSPIEIGNHVVHEFEGAGVPHTVAMYTREELNYDKDKLMSDYKKVVEAATSVVGETPLDKYLFIIHHQQGIGGGLEHLYSTTCMTRPDAYSSDRAYKGFFSLIAHEYFHLWNVKRIRPEALGPFDYENENYTHMLWVAEGFTSYYEELILRRAGLIDDSEVLSTWSSALTSVETQPGVRVQSATEASWDAWIKSYRPDENSYNTTISYYSKGGILASMLNLTILNETNGEKSLDDVLRLLWKKNYQELGRGYTDQEFQKACETVAGKDLSDFFKNHVFGTKRVDYKSYFANAGIDLDISPRSSDPYMGTRSSNGVIRTVISEGSAYAGGINVGDQILSIDGKATSDIEGAIDGKKVGDVIEVELLRSGQKYTYPIKLIADPRERFTLTKMSNMNAKQAKIYKKLMAL